MITAVDMAYVVTLLLTVGAICSWRFISDYRQSVRQRQQQPPNNNNCQRLADEDDDFN